MTAKGCRAEDEIWVLLELLKRNRFLVSNLEGVSDEISAKDLPYRIILGIDGEEGNFDGF